MTILPPPLPLPNPIHWDRLRPELPIPAVSMAHLDLIKGGKYNYGASLKPKNRPFD
jgi:hypothetical protein